jgi:hypothetical protein
VNGVDISDVTHKFAEEEWNKLPVFIGGADVTVKKIPHQSRLFHSRRYDSIQSPIDLNLIIKFDLSLLIQK